MLDGARMIFDAEKIEQENQKLTTMTLKTDTTMQWLG
jgi:hypothetical protein